MTLPALVGGLGRLDGVAVELRKVPEEQVAQQKVNGETIGLKTWGRRSTAMRGEMKIREGEEMTKGRVLFQETGMRMKMRRMRMKISL